MLVGAIACAPATEPGSGSMFDPGCGLPTPRPNAEPKGLHEAFLLDGEVTQLVRVQKRQGGIVAAINVALGVTPAWERYKEASKSAGFKLVGEDNEGFEAEIYLRNPEELGAVQIRTSNCDDSSIAFVSIVSIDELGQTPFVPTPTPSPTRNKGTKR
jgi:hypothetical protein